MLLYSVAGGSFEPWADRQIVRFGIGMVLLLAVALIDIRVWFQLAYPIYGVSLLLLVAVEFFGRMGKGRGAVDRDRAAAAAAVGVDEDRAHPRARAVLARHSGRGRVAADAACSARLVLIALPAALVLMQPNLGTATILIAVGAGLLFLSGLSWKIIVPVIVLAVAAVPVGWEFVLKDYQKQRVYTFLDPDTDPLGSGYNTLQSKIALGSGGVFGKGFGEGTQSRLNFLPEKQTDFIFTVLGEEFGLFGLMILMGLYLTILAQGVMIALDTRSQFGRLVAMGVCLNFLLYILINTSMSMGLIPVVGIPLPLVSYGGTALITVLFGFGLLLSVQIHRGVDIPRSASNLR